MTLNKIDKFRHTIHVQTYTLYINAFTSTCTCLFRCTAKLEYNEHGYNEFTALTNYYACPGKFLTGNCSI